MLKTLIGKLLSFRDLSPLSEPTKNTGERVADIRVPLFNLNISLEHNNPDDGDKRFLGVWHVCSDGSLITGEDKRLETYPATIEHPNLHFTFKGDMLNCSYPYRIFRFRGNRDGNYYLSPHSIGEDVKDFGTEPHFK